jgi:methionine-rich copper-binding protein CopC
MKFSIFNTSFLLLAVLCLVSPSRAFAHAKLLKSSPEANSVVNKAPTETELHFSEDLEVVMCKLEVKNIKSGEVVSQDLPMNAAGDAASLKISLKPLKKEKADYEVSWKAVAKDAHKMPGHFKFTFDPKN